MHIAQKVFLKIVHLFLPKAGSQRMMNLVCFSLNFRRGRGRYLRGSMRNNASIDRVPRFVKFAPLSDENKKLILEAMNEKYNTETKALNLESFGTNKHFGGSSGAIGKLTHSGVVEVILDTIGTHLSDLRYLSLADNQLKFLKDFSKLHEKAPNVHTLHLQKNQVSYYFIF